MRWFKLVGVFVILSAMILSSGGISEPHEVSVPDKGVLDFTETVDKGGGMDELIFDSEGYQKYLDSRKDSITVIEVMQGISKSSKLENNYLAESMDG